jgi:hypothetical protein
MFTNIASTPEWSAIRRLTINGVLGNDDQGAAQIVGHSEVILRSLSTISNQKSASLQRIGRSLLARLNVAANPEALLPVAHYPDTIRVRPG